MCVCVCVYVYVYLCLCRCACACAFYMYVCMHVGVRCLRVRWVRCKIFNAALNCRAPDMQERKTLEWWKLSLLNWNQFKVYRFNLIILCMHSMKFTLWDFTTLEQHKWYSARNECEFIAHEYMCAAWLKTEFVSLECLKLCDLKMDTVLS